METAKYSIIEILEFKNLDQFIIPEIQRDYVWKTIDVLDLLNYIKEGFEGSKKNIPYLGFIYAYNDREYVYKYFLVDGQQRMTTIFLLLLACYHKMGKQLPEYLLKQGKLKLDYKVRQATHDFLSDLVKHCQDNSNDFDFSIKDQVWFHKDYEIDKTIFNLVENFNATRNWLSNINQDQMMNFLKYVEDKVELSYFDIETGRQGEELYIYMNSRGRQLEPNETLKAKYLSTKENTLEKEEWGHKWENWQDFFWKIKGDRPDADAGFNDFLQMVQVINMSISEKSTDDIGEFINGKTNLDYNLLPNTIEDIERYFQSFEWLVKTELVSEFFKQYEKDENFLSSSPTIERRRKQIYYFRILPIITLLAFSEIRDEKIIIRFIRFFYNISRKRLSIGKDISNQLPNAIKLMFEYAQSKNEDFDVCDIIQYHKGRTVLINEEEVLKLNLYKTPPQNKTRQEMEELFWYAEDHYVFDGEINFLLDKYLDKETNKFDIENYIKTWDVFQNLFIETGENNALISRVLLYYGNTWTQSTPNYYLNYNCQDWHTLVRRNSGKYLMNLLEDLHGKNSDFIDIIVGKKAKKYFIEKKFISIESIKAVDELFEQVKILATIDYYSERLIWNYYAYIACYDARFTSETFNDNQFFKNRAIFNVSRYIDSGEFGRVIPMMDGILQNEIKLKELINKIVNY